MPVEAKPLFRPDVLRPYLMAFQLPAYMPGFRPKLAHWAELISSGRADSFKESSPSWRFTASPIKCNWRFIPCPLPPQ